MTKDLSAISELQVAVNTFVQIDWALKILAKYNIVTQELSEIEPLVLKGTAKLKELESQH